FRCFLGGDLAGSGEAEGGNKGDNAADPGTKAFFSSGHANVEGTLGPVMQSVFKATPDNQRTGGKPKYPSAGYCTVMKANHHGSSSSVDVNFLAALSPAIVVISSGLKTRFHEHPTQQVMNRLSGTKTAQWYVDGDAGPQVPNSVQNIYVTEVANRVV